VANHLSPITNGKSDVGSSQTCDLILMLAQAIDHAGINPTRVGIVQALGTMGSFRSANLGDTNWTTPGRFAGGDSQRAIQYQVSCQCWKVVDAFGPAY
jgi:hypothetical protein